MKYFVLARRLISISVLALITLGFFEIFPKAWFLTKLQFGQIFAGGEPLMGEPLIGGAFVYITILIVCLIAGRIYCSTLCPLGTLQDISGGIRKRFAGKNGKYAYRSPWCVVRCLVLIAVVALFVMGFSSLIGLADPFSIYTRGMTRILDPIVGWGAEIASSMLNERGIFFFYSASPILLPPILILLAIFILAFFRGRLFCNTLCPVGAILGCASLSPLIRPTFRENCASCGKCASVCKSECINISEKSIDSSRCVMCGNCAVACPVGAISFLPAHLEKNTGRRAALKSLVSIGGAVFFGALPFLRNKFLSVLPVPKLPSGNSVPVAIPIQIPAGAMSIARFSEKCLACSACVFRCPSKVLRSDTSPGGGADFNFKPRLDFSKSFCQYDCVTCGNVCPTGAIMPLTVSEKHKVQTGIAVYRRGRCVIMRKGERCGACAEHCPTGALEMVSFGGGAVIPRVNPELCVGCGACEYICPVIPQKAITVSPLAIHQSARLLEKNENTETTTPGHGKFLF